MKTGLTNDDHRVIEYNDHFINSKGKSITTRNLGEKSASLNSYFFSYLKGYNIPCGFVKNSGKKSLEFINIVDIGFRVKVLNVSDSRTSKIFSIKQGSPLELPIIEYHFGESKESVITESHIISFNLCNYDDLKLINRLSSKINAIIKSFFERRNISLVELCCTFGKFESKIFLIGDFSPDNLKIRDHAESKKMPDPYKIETSQQMKNYADHLLKLTNGE